MLQECSRRKHDQSALRKPIQQPIRNNGQSQGRKLTNQKSYTFQDCSRRNFLICDQLGSRLAFNQPMKSKNQSQVRKLTNQHSYTFLDSSRRNFLTSNQ